MRAFFIGFDVRILGFPIDGTARRKSFSKHFSYACLRLGRGDTKNLSRVRVPITPNPIPLALIPLLIQISLYVIRYQLYVINKNLGGISARLNAQYHIEAV